MNQFEIIEILNQKQINQLHTLAKKMWWSNDRTLDEINKMLANCLSFGLIHNDDLIGCARVLTDEIKYAFIFDVIIEEEYRNKGLSKLLMEAILDHQKLQQITCFDLTCAPDMVAYYEKLGFSKDFINVVPMRFTKSNSQDE
ncbi:MAG: GNAT family N-acetyltransferase [Gammaproteobacteria bacterium]|nr:GNAT family N-acetyltransferase [Gammaproteobacteria bacterium]